MGHRAYLTDQYKGGYLIRFLPFVEQQALFDRIVFNVNPEVNSYLGSAPTGPVYKQVVGAFLCPSGSDKRFWPGGGWNKREGALSHYGLNVGNAPSSLCGMGGDYWNRGLQNSRRLDEPRQDFRAVFDDVLVGLVCRHHRTAPPTRSPWARCGPSATCLHGTAGCTSTPCGLMTTAPINYPTCPDEPGYNSDPNSCHSEQSWGKAMGFKSRHSGGANFVMCDGSTHFISENIDYVTYQKLGDRWDGLPIRAEPGDAV